MFCNQCGKEIKEGARFCNHCGALTDINSIGSGLAKPTKGKKTQFVVIAVALLAVIGIGATAFTLGRGSAPSGNSRQLAEETPRPRPTPTPTQAQDTTTETDIGFMAESVGGETSSGGVTTAPSYSGDRIINVYAFGSEIPDALARYKELNPSFGWELNPTIINDEAAYLDVLEQALIQGGSSAPDLYVLESAYVLRFTQGDVASFAAPYEDLISDFQSKLAAAQVAQYGVDIGTRNGHVVAMRYQETGSCLIYRRSIANDIWGTDDPAEIAKITGPGWDKFLSAAADLKGKGYYAVAGFEDVWQALNAGAARGWTAGERLVIDPAREYAFDFAKTMQDNGYWAGANQWSDRWFAEMSQNNVFAYLGPAWLINYVIVNNCGNTYGDWAITTSPAPWTWGGTWVMGNNDLFGDKAVAVGQLIEWITLDTSETGFQYYFAHGTLYDEPGAKGTVVSRTVMEKSDGSLDFLGGQDMFDYFLLAGANVKSSNWNEYDRYINNWFQEQVQQYYEGNKTKERAMADFRATVLDQLGFE
jgi:hypothetical protein